MTVTVGVELLYIGHSSSGVTSVKTRTKPLPPDVKPSPNATPEDPVKVIDIKNPPANPLFQPQATGREDKLEVAYELFKDLARYEKHDSGVEASRYETAVAEFIDHLTSVPRPSDEELDEIISHGTRRTSGYGRGRPTEYYPHVDLQTWAYILRVDEIRGEHR